MLDRTIELQKGGLRGYELQLRTFVIDIVAKLISVRWRRKMECLTEREGIKYDVQSVNISYMCRAQEFAHSRSFEDVMDCADGLSATCPVNLYL